MDRKDYAKKLNEYFKNSGINYEYKKNDENIYNFLCKYGSLDKARNNSKKLMRNIKMMNHHYQKVVQ